MKKTLTLIFKAFIAALPPLFGLGFFYFTEWHALLGVALGIFVAYFINNIKSGGTSSVVGGEALDDGGASDDGGNSSGSF